MTFDANSETRTTWVAGSRRPIRRTHHAKVGVSVWTTLAELIYDASVLGGECDKTRL